MYKLSIIQYPSKRFGFVGRVPSILAYSGASEKELKAIAQVGPGLIMKQNPNIKSLSWETEQDAKDFAKLNNILI